MINEAILKNEELAAFRLRALYSGFGYMQYKMSKFEEYDLYVKNKDFLISDRVITFTDTNGKLLALKPDVTLSIINNLGKTIDGIHKMYYSENVYRVSGATGKFKEIMQTGLECIGDIGIYETSEVLFLAIKSLMEIHGDFRLEISHAALVEALLKENGIDDNILAEALEAIRIKSSGLLSDMLAGGKISDKAYELIGVLSTSFGDINEFSSAVKPFISTPEAEALLEEFTAIVSAVSSERISRCITVNCSLSCDAGYYSGIVFKGYISGIPTSVLSGGQYDKLMKKLGNKGGAVGFAVYLDSFERFGGRVNEYDVDTVLLVSEGASPEKLLLQAETIRQSGESVLVSDKLPTDKRYRRVVKAED